MISRRDANIESTRAALLAVARIHFARDGFATAELARIASEAGVTTGAIYHHFGSKKGLFKAVAEQMEAEILAVAAAGEGADAWQRLRASFDRLVDWCAAPDIQRILRVEAPQVIGPEAWHEIELRYAYGATRATLDGLMAAGVLRRAPVDLVARLLLALLSEAAAERARSGDDAAVRAEIAAMVSGVLDSLRAG